MIKKKRPAPKAKAPAAAPRAEEDTSRAIDRVIKSIVGLGDNELTLAHEALQAELYRRSQK